MKNKRGVTGKGVRKDKEKIKNAAARTEHRGPGNQLPGDSAHRPGGDFFTEARLREVLERTQRGFTIEGEESGGSVSGKHIEKIN